MRYKLHGLNGGHLIKLGPGNDEVARDALRAWPGLPEFHYLSYLSHQITLRGITDRGRDNRQKCTVVVRTRS